MITKLLMARAETIAPANPTTAEQTVLKVLLAMSFSHLLNDTIQSLLPAIYPLLKENYHLTFTQIGLITLAYNTTASLLQPVVGSYTDRRPKPYSLAFGMCITLCGLILLSRATAYPMILVAAAMVGTGSSIFHPEASRIAHMAAGGRHGFAQSLFQVGGNLGSSLGPLAGLVIVAHGQSSIIWFGGIAGLGIYILFRVGGWYQRNLEHYLARTKARRLALANKVPRKKVILSVGILLLLIFSKYVYLVSLSNYYTFYLIHQFHVSVQQSQVCLFIFLFAVAAGTFFGGPLGDRFGRKYIIWFSILGVAPFSLTLPHVGLAMTIIPDGVHWWHPVLRFFGDPRLCAGTDSGKSGPDRRTFLRLRIWRRRPRLRGFGQARRSHQHRPRLFSLRLPAVDRRTDCTAAQYPRRSGHPKAAAGFQGFLAANHGHLFW